MNAATLNAVNKAESVALSGTGNPKPSRRQQTRDKVNEIFG